MPKYQDFVLIVNGTVERYTVEAQGPGDIRVPPVPFAYQETDELRIELGKIKMGFAPSTGRMQKVGEILFKALFPYEIIAAFNRAQGGLPAGESLRLKLIARPAELGHLPWELIYDILNQSFLAVRSSCPIVRYIEQGTPPASLLARRPLRVLYLQANPKGTTQLDNTASEATLRQALGEAGEVMAVRDTTPSALRDVLRGQSFHVLHYDGHGAFEGTSGYLYLHDAQGQIHKLSGEMLAAYLDGTPVRLVVLSACETAVDSSQKRFAGIAQQLMRTTNLPAVVAMQYEIPDQSALAFTGEFYKALADDYPVDAAVVEGRKAILELLGGDPFGAPDWATPVLFMRSKDGNILKQDASEENRAVSQEKEKDSGKHVSVSGGTYVDASGGSLTVSGDLVGGSKITNVGGDYVGRDKITTTSGMTGDDLAKVFATLTQKVNAMPDGPDKDIAKSAVQGLEAEAKKGEAASEGQVSRWLTFLAQTAPDAWQVAVETFKNPIQGLGLAFQKIAQKATAGS
ncbi:MAG: CHAT domain-containing protein [Thermoflexales bacterium]|nr:CHAT domain-containing protein [Thermoflexales bacterium]